MDGRDDSVSRIGLYRRFGAVLGRLYGWNTLGAVVGALVGEVVLIGWLGSYGAAGCAAMVNVIAAGISLALANRIESGTAAGEPGADSAAPEPVRLKRTGPI